MGVFAIKFNILKKSLITIRLGPCEYELAREMFFLDIIVLPG